MLAVVAVVVVVVVPVVAVVAVVAVPSSERSILRTRPLVMYRWLGEPLERR